MTHHATKAADTAPADAEPTDADIAAMLSSHPGLLAMEEQRCTTQINRVIGTNLDRRWITAKRAYFSRQLIVANRPRPPGSSEPAIEQQVAHYKVYKKCAAEFASLMDRLQIAMTHGTMHKLAFEMQRDASCLEQQLSPVGPAAAPVVQFDCVTFVKRLASQGVTVRAPGAEGIEVFPANLLSASDRELLQANRDAIRQTVAGLTVTF